MLGEYDKAIEDCNRTLSINPNELTAYLNRAQAYRLTFKYDKAIQDFKKLDKLPYDKSRIQTWLGYCYFHKGDKKSAIFYFKNSIAIKKASNRTDATTKNEINELEQEVKSIESGSKLIISEKLEKTL
jgi:tetratricopeptide (TPR) repeat protein